MCKLCAVPSRYSLISQDIRDKQVFLSPLQDALSSAIKDVKVWNSFVGGSRKTMISQTVEYALRAIVTIAQHGGTPCTAQKISAITKVPAPYLSKMMQGLVRASLVTSKRGLHGGFVLTKEPSDLTIWEVVDAVEPVKRIRECPLGIGTHEESLCPLHRRLDQAMALVEESFRTTTVADVLSQPGSVTPLCEEKELTPMEFGKAGKQTAKKSSKKTTAKRKKKQTSKG